jgi:hypothetical protein
MNSLNEPAHACTNPAPAYEAILEGRRLSAAMRAVTANALPTLGPPHPASLTRRRKATRRKPKRRCAICKGAGTTKRLDNNGHTLALVCACKAGGR